jgi:hypothetical protein
VSTALSLVSRQPASAPDEVTCTARLCGDPAVALMRGGCAHEHVKDRWLCAFHSGEVGQASAYCAECESADGHICRIGWAELERTDGAS